MAAHVDNGDIAVVQCSSLRLEQVVDLVGGGKTSGT